MSSLATTHDGEDGRVKRLKRAAQCSLTPPSSGLQHAQPIRRPDSILPWGESNISGLLHSNSMLFSPTETSADGWYNAMRASQFPSECRRYMLLEDDLDTAGVGWTASMLSVALALAVRDGRVLLEQQVNSSWGHRTGEQRVRNKRGHGLRPRWCTRPPFTLQCFYKPWTHCGMPSAAEVAAAAVPGEPNKYRRDTAHANVVKVKLTWLADSGAKIWMGSSKKRTATGGAFRLLFQPRPWVVKLARCVMREHGLVAGSFFSVHVRESAEKAAEIRRLRQGFRMPRLLLYFDLTQALASRLGQRAVFLQTASPRAVDNFSSWAAGPRVNLSLSYTDNPRSEHDTWGGWQTDDSTIMTGSIVAAVNAHVARQAAAVISPANSAWTSFLTLTAGQQAHAFSFCCRCAGHGNFKIIAMSDETVAALGNVATLPKSLGRPTPCRAGAAGR